MDKEQKDTVTLKVDGKEVTVPIGTNLIQAALKVHVEIPYYCYHPHLSVAGNCRMCQVQVKGQPKLTIACNTEAQEGMEVLTQLSSKEVEDAQAATLEFLLINHPLDCTVCDQAGHCKLQDYHFRFNARSSRFLEDKVRKVKAQPLGPTVMLDGERCILCTRCVRFCDEVTGTSELGVLNRGDTSVIAISEGKELNNPLSGTVVDLCPVGALTHRSWRFNTRIWFTDETDSICPGCSTGCNVKVAVRDREVVQVKGRLNAEVNKEWLCDEGRYGFNRFLPQNRLVEPLFRDSERLVSIDWEAAADRAAGWKKDGRGVVFVSPDLLLEEYWLLKEYLGKSGLNWQTVLAYRERELTETEKILISPDYAANFQGAVYSGLVDGDLESDYSAALAALKQGEYDNVLVVGERGILKADLDAGILGALGGVSNSVGIISDAENELLGSLRIAFPERSVLEKSGLLLNRNRRLQYSDKVIESPQGARAAWNILSLMAGKAGADITGASQDRELTISYLTSAFEGKYSIGMIKKSGGVPL